MTKVERIIEQAQELPAEEQWKVVDKLMESLNPIDADAEWVQVELRRRDEIRSGKAERIPGDEVMERIRQHIAK